MIWVNSRFLLARVFLKRHLKFVSGGSFVIFTDSSLSEQIVEKQFCIIAGKLISCVVIETTLFGRNAKATIILNSTI